MNNPTVMLRVKFKSTLPLDEIMEIVEARAGDFRALPGLIQKYYLYNDATEELAGLYLWESPEALDEYRKSELRASIAAAYQATGEPEIEVFRIVKTLRE